MARDADFRQTHVKTRKVISPRGEVVYGADIETTGVVLDGDNPEFRTESHAGGVEAACGCLIEGNLKPRFHRNGTMVCTSHYYFCAVCAVELLPLQAVIVDKRIYCRGCGEHAIDEILISESANPGSFDKALLAHLRFTKRALRSNRWRNAFSWLLGPNEQLVRR